MLTGETLKPYLLHDDRWVRCAVAEYFYESWSVDEDLVPTILDACSRYGFEDNSLPLAHCRRFPLTRTAFGRVLHLLSEDISEKIVMHLGGILAQAPANLLREHENAILSTDALQDDHRRRIRHRLALMSWSGERLWTEIQDRAERHSHAESLSNVDSSYDDALTDAVAGHDVPDTDTICRMLADPVQGNAWLEDYLIELAGARRLTEAIPALVDKLRSDDETFLDSCPLALAKIGHPDIVRRIADVYPKEPWSFRDASASLLGEIKHPDAEEAILRLLPAEDDLEVRTLLCFGLCRLFSDRGVEVVRRQIHDGYEQWLVNLEEALLPVATVLGIALPEADAWKEEREERERLQAERLFELNEFGGEYRSRKVQDMNPFGDSNPPLSRTQSAYSTVRRHDDKVGRNDPCPCGSGKKFKKCCLGR